MSWLAVPLVEWLFGLGAWSRPDTHAFLVESLGWLALGLLHRRVAKEGWAASLAWAPVLLVWAFVARWSWVAGAIGLPVMVVLVRVLDDGLRRWPVLLVPLLLVSGGTARLVELAAAPVADPLGELWHQLPDRRVESISAPPIVLITVDTLRADSQATMAAYKRFPVRWDHALSTSSWTVPALASAHTGLLPDEHGSGRGASGFTAIRADVPTLAELLEGEGYTTAAFVANPFASRQLGLARGFARWDNPDENAPHGYALIGGVEGDPRDATQVVDRALTWLETDAPERGFFLWVHLMDPHWPYLDLGPEELPRLVRKGETQLSKKDRQRFRLFYDAEVEHADAELLRLVRGLEGHGVFEGGVLVLTSDHGEEFWERGGWEHGHGHQPEVVDIAIGLSAPGWEPAARTDTASLIDIFAWVRGTPTRPERVVQGTLYGPQLETRVEGSVRTTTGWSGVDGSAVDVNEEALRRLGYLD
ncbi:MAG TPA: sulfatase [Myxococcota bacterium]|nr:sulfatase [Myxococcota bacterium]